MNRPIRDNEIKQTPENKAYTDAMEMTKHEKHIQLRTTPANNCGKELAFNVGDMNLLIKETAKNVAEKTVKATEDIVGDLIDTTGGVHDTLLDFVEKMCLVYKLTNDDRTKILTDLRMFRMAITVEVANIEKDVDKLAKMPLGRLAIDIAKLTELLNDPTIRKAFKGIEHE